MDEVHLSEAQQVKRTMTASSRSLDQYLAILQLSLADLQGKRILDCGSGPECRFATELRSLVPSARVSSFDACFLSDDHCPVGAVGGYFGALPFDDGSFDLVVSLFACPLYCEGQQLTTLALQEICRVLARGGTARIAPLVFHRRFDAGQADSSLTQDEIIRSRTIISTERGLRETMLQDVAYSVEPDVFDHIISQLPSGYQCTIVETDNTDLGREYRSMLKIMRW